MKNNRELMVAARKNWLATTALGNNDKILVVHSGGQDSTTSLALMRHLAPEAEIHTVGFNYGQKHGVELQVASYSARLFGVGDEQQHLVDLPFLQTEVTTELLATATGDVGDEHAYLKNRPASFVPVRNALFLTTAYGLALELGASFIVTGVCQTDYSGYPDCREEFITQLNGALNVGYESNVTILTPMMHIDKAETFKMADDIGALEVILDQTHTCYNGIRTPHDWGRGCGECPACKLRAEGYTKFRELYYV